MSKRIIVFVLLTGLYLGFWVSIFTGNFIAIVVFVICIVLTNIIWIFDEKIKKQRFERQSILNKAYITIVSVFRDEELDLKEQTPTTNEIHQSRKEL